MELRHTLGRKAHILHEREHASETRVFRVWNIGLNSSRGVPIGRIAFVLLLVDGADYASIRSEISMSEKVGGEGSN